MKRIHTSVHQSIILTAFILVALASYAMSSHPSRPTEVGRYSTQQALRMADAMNRIIGSSGARITVSSLQVPQNDGSITRYWQADLVDTAGREAGHVTWDADTGEVVMFSRGPRTSAAPGRTPLAPDSADSTAAYWLSAIGWRAGGRQWAREGQPSWLGRRNWQTKWKAADRRAWVVVDGRTGELVFARLEVTGGARRSAA